MKFFRLFFLFVLLSGVVLATTPAKDLFIPAGARATGAYGTFWKTDLRVLNTCSSVADVTIYYLPRSSFAGHATSTTVSLNANETRVFENVLETLFGITDNTAGGFRLTSNCNLVVESRTWTPAPEGATGTYGQRIPGIPKDFEVRAGESVNVLYIDNTADFRTNLGMIETSGSGSSITLHLYDGNGTHIGQQDVQLGPYEDNQIDGILSSFGVSSGTNYRVVFEVVSGSAIPYSSQVDNASGDPIYVDGSVARCGGGNGGGGSCGNGKYFGYNTQTNNGDWEGFINSPLNVTVDNWNITAWDEDDMGIVYITPSNYVILLGYGGIFETPIPISDGEPFNITYSLEYTESGDKTVLTADFVIDGTLSCNYLTGTINAVVKALDPDFKTYAGKFYWNFEGGLQ